MSKKTRNIIIASAALVFIVVLTSPKVKLFDSQSEASGPNPAGVSQLPVTAFIVKPEKLSDKIISTGTVQANEEVELRSETSGKITHISFKEGTWVPKGTLLVKINDAELQAELLKLEHQKKLAEDVEARRKKLLDSQLISPEDYEKALNDLNSINAEVQLAKAKIEKTEIHAPFDGIVGLRYVSEGSYVSADTRIASFQNVTKVKIDFSIPEKYANSVHAGQTVRFTVAGSVEKYAGKIFAIEPKIDPVSRTVQLRALSGNSDRRITPGAFAEVELLLEIDESALMIPSEALVPELKGQTVFVYKNGLAEQQKVEAGIRTETRVQVTSGLQPNDTLITSGILQLAPGLPVKISELN